MSTSLHYAPWACMVKTIIYIKAKCTLSTILLKFMSNIMLFVIRWQLWCNIMRSQPNSCKAHLLIPVINVLFFLESHQWEPWGSEACQGAVSRGRLLHRRLLQTQSADWQGDASCSQRRNSGWKICSGWHHIFFLIMTTVLIYRQWWPTAATSVMKSWHCSERQEPPCLTVPIPTFRKYLILLIKPSC